MAASALAITTDEYAKAFGVVAGDTGVYSAMIRPDFGKDDYVWLAEEYTIPAGSTTSFVYNPYKVVGYGVETFDSGGGLIKCYAADRTTAAVSATVASAVDTPTFFAIENEKGKTTYGVHGSRIIDRTALDALVGGEVSDWKTPTF